MKPVFILGFDGLSPLFWEDSPLLPTGTVFRGILKSVDPPISPAAWASFCTGVDPEMHGITRWRKDEWVPRFPIFGHSLVHPVWLGTEKTFALYNVPCLKPLPDANRVYSPPDSPNVTSFVGGLLWSANEYYAKPQKLYKRLTALNYSVDLNGWDLLPIDVRKTDEGLDWILEKMRHRRRLETPAADITVLIYSFPDRVSHNAWRQRDIIKRMHMAVYAEAQYWLEDRCIDLTHNWIIISDHGFQDVDAPNHLAILTSIGEDRIPWMEGGHHVDGVFMSNSFDMTGKSIKDVLVAAINWH